jgi:serine/threonine-protein kinase
LEIDPAQAAAYFNRGNVRRARGDLDGALADYGEALRLRPDDTAALLNRGRVLWLMGRHEEGLADARAAVEKAPDDAAALNDLAWLLACCPRDDLRRPEEAVEVALKALEKAGDASTLDTLASALAAAGRFEEAVQRQREAVEKADETAKADFGVRLALYEAGQPYREA